MQPSPNPHSPIDNSIARRHAVMIFELSFRESKDQATGYRQDQVNPPQMIRFMESMN